MKTDARDVIVMLPGASARARLHASRSMWHESLFRCRARCPSAPPRDAYDKPPSTVHIDARSKERGCRQPDPLPRARARRAAAERQVRCRGRHRPPPRRFTRQRCRADFARAAALMLLPCAPASPAMSAKAAALLPAARLKHYCPPFMPPVRRPRTNRTNGFDIVQRHRSPHRPVAAKTFAEVSFFAFSCHYYYIFADDDKKNPPMR